MKRILFVAIMMVIMMATTAVVMAQAPDRNEDKAKVQGQVGDSTFNAQVQREKSDRTERAAPGAPGERGPAGVPGPQGAPGPQGPSGPGGGFLGMDPTIALLIGLGVLAVVIVAIVAASRGGRET